MIADEQKRRIEDGEKEWIILLEIETRIEALGGRVSPERKAGLITMTMPELQQLALDMQGIQTSQEAITRTVMAITVSKHARKAAEDKKLDALCSPASVDWT
jgi:hypothetical protein